MSTDQSAQGVSTKRSVYLFAVYADPELRDEDHNTIAVFPAHRMEEARRVVACWNACDGIPTESLVKVEGDTAPVFELLMQTTAERDALASRVRALEGERDTPQLHNFSEAVTLEALHQRARWGSEHDAGKLPADWFWLVGYLAGKALHAQTAGNTDKALHHTISTAAALANWHAAITGDHTAMRPGIDDAALTTTSGDSHE